MRKVVLIPILLFILSLSNFCSSEESKTDDVTGTGKKDIITTKDTLSTKDVISDDKKDIVTPKPDTEGTKDTYVKDTTQGKDTYEIYVPPQDTVQPSGLTCYEFFECAGECTVCDQDPKSQACQTCIQNCFKQMDPFESVKLQNLITCMDEQCGKYDDETQSNSWNYCLDKYCRNEIVDCFSGDTYKTCGELVNCLNNCEDQDCMSNCLINSTPDAQLAFYAIFDCAEEQLQPCFEANCSQYNKETQLELRLICENNTLTDPTKDPKCNTPECGKCINDYSNALSENGPCMQVIYQCLGARNCKYSIKIHKLLKSIKQNNLYKIKK